MPPAIRCHGLGKSYRISHEQAGGKAGYRMIREDLVRGLKAPLRWLRGQRGTSQREEFWALRDVSFEVEPGEVIGIIGRNGAGKSTLLKILSRITKPTRGHAQLDGRVGSLLEVGTGFHPELTGRENIYLNGAILGMGRREIQRKFDEIVAFAEIARFLDTPVKRYSSGMYVRLAFAVAAHLEPEILLVDEVLAVGDAQFQEKCMGVMRDQASTGRTVLFVSHNLASIQQLCNRVILVKEGRIAADGAPAPVVKEYFAQALKGSKVDLRSWPDRQTNGDARITHVEISDGNGEPTTCIPVGGTVCLTITAEFYRPVTDPAFGVVIQSAVGEPLIYLRSIHDGLRLGRVTGEVAVKVKVDNLGLYPGEYLLGPEIINPGARVVLDWAKQCCSLRMDPAAGPKGDLKLDSRWGKYWVPSEWMGVKRV
jgi:lipopolysaccharide transport system ATP-binding protein